jgi:hypothetical protein
MNNSFIIDLSEVNEEIYYPDCNEQLNSLDKFKSDFKLHPDGIHKKQIRKSCCSCKAKVTSKTLIE